MEPNIRFAYGWIHEKYTIFSERSDILLDLRTSSNDWEKNKINWIWNEKVRCGRLLIFKSNCVYRWISPHRHYLGDLPSHRSHKIKLNVRIKKLFKFVLLNFSKTSGFFQIYKYIIQLLIFVFFRKYFWFNAKSRMNSRHSRFVKSIN